MGRSIKRAPSAAQAASGRGGGLERDERGGFGGSDDSAEQDGYTDRLMKLIPAEVVAFFLAMDAAIIAHNDTEAPVVLGIWLVGCIATWFHLTFVAKVDNWPQIAVSVGAFAVWALNIGHGFQVHNWIEPGYAVLLLLAYTFFAPELPFLKRER